MGLTMTTMTIVARPVPTARDTEMVALPKGAVTTGAMGATTIETTGVVVSAENAPRISAKQPASASAVNTPKPMSSRRHTVCSVVDS